MRNKIYVSFVIILIAGIIIAFSLRKTDQCKPASPNETLYVTKVNGDYVVINELGERKMTLYYKYVSSFDEEGIAYFYENKKVGFIDQSCHKGLTSYDVLRYRKSGFYIIEKNHTNYVINKDHEILYQFDDFTVYSITDTATYIRTENKDRDSQKRGIIQIKNGTFNVLLEPIYEDVRLPIKDDSLIYYQSDTRQDYMDSDGHAFGFDEVNQVGIEFPYGYNFVKKDGKWALLKSSGDYVTDFIFDGVLSVLSDDYAVVSKNGKYAIMSTNGVLLTDYIYDDVYRNNYFIEVKQDGLWKLQDFHLTDITPYKYQEISLTYDNYTRVKRNNYFTLIDENGTELMDAIYDDVYSFHNSLATVIRNGKYGLINEQGEEVITAKYDQISFSYNSYDYNRLIVKLHDKWGAIDLEGNQIVDFIYDSIEFLSNQYFLVSNDCHFGIINIESGQYVLDTGTSQVKYLGNGEFNVNDSIVSIGEKHAYDKFYITHNIAFYLKDHQLKLMDSKGEPITNTIYEEEFEINQDGIFVKKDGKIGKIDFNGKIMLPFKFEQLIFIENHDFMFVKENEKWGIIDQNGNYLLEPIYDELNSESYIEYKDKSILYNHLSYPTEYLKFKQNGKWGLLSLNNYQPLIQPEYDDITIHFMQQLIEVKLDHHYGLIDYDGNIILPAKYGQFSLN